MKFCEKLQKLRKEKGYSQEQLADLLDVSRQSVSKWESGTTYPEMDKLLSLCKIFNVSLDELTNDEITDKNIKEKNRSNFSNVVYAILDMINKSIEMFKNMDRKNLVKCITELLILFIILLIFKIPFNYVNNSVINIFTNFSNNAYNLLTSIWLFLSNVIYLILFVTIFIFVYKIRFLDKFSNNTIIKKEDIENKEEIKIKEENGTKNTDDFKTSKVKHSFILFDVLGSMFNIFIKICLLFIIVPIILCFVFLVIFTTISLILIFTGIHYIGIFIALFGATFALAIIMELFIRLLLSSNVPFKRMFLMFLTGLIIIGIGSAITAFEISNTQYIDKLPIDAKMIKEDYVYNMQDDLIINNNYNSEINYIVDENITDSVKLEIEYYNDYIDLEIYENQNTINIYNYTSWNNTISYLNLLKENLKDKTFYNYGLLSQFTINVISNSKNIEKIKENINEYYRLEEQRAEEYSYYIEEIDRLNEELYNKDNNILELEEKIRELENKLDNIENLIQ